MKNLKNKQSGLALLETLFYIFIFAGLSIVIMNAMFYMARSFKETSIHTELMQSSDIMEKISREIKQAISVHTINSTFLKLNTKDSAGVDKTITFTISGTNLQMFENDILVGNLNGSNIEVTGLSFSSITTTSGRGIKVSFSASSVRDDQNRVFDFYNTINLRGNY